MIHALFDTNILIDYLNGKLPARTELDSFSRKLISGITYIEVLVGAREDFDIIKQFLEGFEIIWVSKPVADKAIEVRKQYNMKLPDAIILATALINNAILVTRNTKDFPEDKPYVRIPYKI